MKKLTKMFRLLAAEFLACSMVACLMPVELPKVGEPFDHDAWNVQHSPDKFLLLGTLVGGQDLYQLGRTNQSQGALMEGIWEPLPLGLVVKDGIVSEQLPSKEQMDSKESLLRQEEYSREQAAQQEQQLVSIMHTPAPAYESTFTPVNYPYGGSPVIKGFFLGMPMEQAVDNLNKRLLESTASDQASRVAADWPGLLGIEFEQLPVREGRGYNMVDKRVLIECLRPARNTNNDWDGECSTDKFYIVQKFTRPCCPTDFTKKIYSRRIYPSPDISRKADAFINLGSTRKVYFAGIHLNFDETDHLQKIEIGAEQFNAAELSAAELAQEIFRSYEIPADVETFDPLKNPEGPFVFLSKGRWQLTVSEDKPITGLGFEMAMLSALNGGKKVTLEKVAPKPTPVFD